MWVAARRLTYEAPLAPASSPWACQNSTSNSRPGNRPLTSRVFHFGFWAPSITVIPIVPTGVSLAAQGCDRVHLRRAARGDVAGRETDSGQHQRHAYERGGIGGPDSIEQAGERPGRGQCAGQPQGD